MAGSRGGEEEADPDRAGQPDGAEGEKERLTVPTGAAGPDARARAAAAAAGVAERASGASACAVPLSVRRKVFGTLAPRCTIGPLVRVMRAMRANRGGPPVLLTR